MNLVLIGFMGSGKTRVGKVLEKKLGRRRVDTDEWIEKEKGESVPHLIRSKGEEGFRAIEREAILAISQLKDVIISTGGGAPLDPENMQALKAHGVVFWLDVSAETALSRIENLGSRPLLDAARPLDSAKDLLNARKEAYGQAHVKVDANGPDPDAIASDIIREFEKKIS